MDKLAYAAIAAGAVVEDEPSDWPDGWPWPPADEGPFPPGFESASTNFTSPSPADSANGVSQTATLTWTFTLTIDGDVYLASSYEVMIDGVIHGTTSSASYYPGSLSSGQHTWRVIAIVGADRFVGPEWDYETILTLSGAASIAPISTAADVWDAALFLSGAAAVAEPVSTDADLTQYDPPDDPSNVVATWGAKYTSGYAMRYINGAWDDNSDDETGFQASYSLDLSSWQQQKTFAANTTSFGDAAGMSTFDSPGYDIYLRVRAYKTVDGVTLYSAWSVSDLLVHEPH